MVPLAAAVQFLLISPAFVRRAFTPQELGRATAFFPFVGLLLGGLLAAADFLLAGIFPIPVRSALILGLWIVLTGALHFDGFLDACDGLLGGHTPEQRMGIMRDERTGAYAVAAAVLLLLIMFSAMTALGTPRWAAFLLAPTLGRCGITLSVVMFPYARPAGLGRDIKDHAGIGQAAAALLTTVVVAGILAWRLRSPVPGIAFVLAAVVWCLASAFVLRKLPGMTGDTYGAINMLIEAIVLLTFVAAR